MKMTRTVASASLAGLCALALGAVSQGGSSVGEPATVVLGTFDSRAVAAAYYRSDRFGAELEALRKRVAEAEAAGDAALAEELAAAGPALQEQAHARVFGNARVPDLLELLREDLDEIAAEAGVDVIVSQWDLEFRSPSARTVDVSLLLAGRFDPDAETLDVIRQVMETEPVPLDELHHDH